uniref:lysozyme n=1 Tax=Megaselia scalaris TaxID=36166 RepID=T1GCL1_MEGSC
MKTSFVLLLISLGVLSVQGKIYSKCELARTLSQNGIPRSELPDWDYGIFQINDHWWCKPSNGRFSYNECGLQCERDLLSDDITKAITCAKKIKGRQGFKAWYGWQKKCQGKSLPSFEVGIFNEKEISHI